MTLRIPPALHHRRFFMLWLGLMISVAGTQMQVWALFWHIRTLPTSPSLWVGLAWHLAGHCVLLIGGAVADVANRRRVLYITQSAQALLAAALTVLTFSGHIALWQIYLLTALQAVAIAFDQPARQALVPNLVPARDLPNAFSLISIAYQMGAMWVRLGGLVIAYSGQAYTYLINAISTWR
jgi:MFS family permease